MSNFVLLHMKKMKGENLSGLKKHTARKFENHKNTEIDVSKSHLNISLIPNHDLQSAVEQEIEENYTSKRKYRSDAVVLDSFIISASQEYMKKLSREKQILYFEEAKKYFEDKYGHVVMADIHFDETNPHMHLGLVPLVYDEKRDVVTLSSKMLFDRKELRNLQENFPKYMQSKGFSVIRGIKNNEKKYIDDIEEFKKEKTREILKLRKEGKDVEIGRIRDLLKNKDEKGLVSKHIKLDLEERDKILAKLPYVDDFFQAKRLLKHQDANDNSKENRIHALENRITELEQENLRLERLSTISKRLFDSSENTELTVNEQKYIINEYDKITEPLANSLIQFIVEMPNKHSDNPTFEDYADINISWEIIKETLKEEVDKRVHHSFDDWSKKTREILEMAIYTAVRKNFVKESKGILNYKNNTISISEDYIQKRLSRRGRRW